MKSQPAPRGVARTSSRARAHAAVEVLREHVDPSIVLRVLAHVCLDKSFEQALAAVEEPAPFEEPSRSEPVIPRLGAPALQSTAALLQGPVSKLEVAVYLGAAYEAILAASATRRERGAHHTSPELAREVVRLAAAPFVGDEQSLKVCDPAVGSGVFLVEALGLFAEDSDVDEWIASRLFGVDVDATAVFLTRVALCSLSSGSDRIRAALRSSIVCDDFVTASKGGGPSWLPEVDLFVGNPPWIAYKGRAAEKLEPARRSYLVSSSPAFAGYPTLHGVFVERCARALRPGGRLGLVVPTSVADLDGYAPTRAAHDRYCSVDPALPDYGARAFDGVFQPAMALLSTARPAPVTPGDDTWELARDDLDETTRALLSRTANLPCLPAELFGERGIQTSSEDRARLSKKPTSKFSQPLLSGTEVRPFDLLGASTFIDPRDFQGRLRNEADWAAVRVLIRQTARFPIAASANGTPFRNSILAGFETKDFPGAALLAFLNARPTRFLHYQRFRDARQGMPQLKIGHLRRLPLPSGSSPFLTELAEIGRKLEETRRTRADTVELEGTLDRVVADAFAMTLAEREIIDAWARGPGKVPEPRRRATS